jgi:Leucine-rich repeat (LRR) protein
MEWTLRDINVWIKNGCNNNDVSQIESLFLMCYDLKTIPAEIGKLINLRFLILKDNILTTFPAEIKNLINLEELYLCNNNFKEIPEEVYCLINLKELHLVNNFLTSFSKKISNL